MLISTVCEEFLVSDIIILSHDIVTERSNTFKLESIKLHKTTNNNWRIKQTQAKSAEKIITCL